MTEKRPKDMTEAEREALPTGPFGLVDGNLVRFGTRSDYIRQDDVLLWVDSSGRSWMFGQFTDGRWFKRASPI